MSILEPETIDFIAVAEDHIALIQLDALEWGKDMDDGEHAYLIQESINTCLEYFESGQLKRDYPDETDLPVRIVLVPVHPLAQLGLDLIEHSKPVVEGAGLELAVDPDYGSDPED